MSWEKQTEWWGNPELDYECYKKEFVAPYGGKIPVYLWGRDGEGKNKPCRDIEGNIVEYKDFPDWHFTVNAGRTSDYSYTGGFYPDCPTLQEAMDKIETLGKQKKLIT